VHACTLSPWRKTGSDHSSGHPTVEQKDIALINSFLIGLKGCYKLA